jgi:hypothetical protein
VGIAGISECAVNAATPENLMVLPEPGLADATTDSQPGTQMTD